MNAATSLLRLSAGHFEFGRKVLLLSSSSSMPGAVVKEGQSTAWHSRRVNVQIVGLPLLRLCPCPCPCARLCLWHWLRSWLGILAAALV